MIALNTRSAVITGASQGIGKAIASALGRTGAKIVLAGRSLSTLGELKTELGGADDNILIKMLDLSDIASIDKFAAEITAEVPDLDILINCGGDFDRADWWETSIQRFDELYRVNVRGTYALTRALLPLLIRTSGDVVFMNSSIVFSSAPQVGPYAATRRALQAIADALREEVNADGVRVLSIYPGRTATPGQETIHKMENKEFRPASLLQPDDIADVVMTCVSLPPTAEVTDVRIRPRFKSP